MWGKGVKNFYLLWISLEGSLLRTKVPKLKRFLDEFHRESAMENILSNESGFFSLPYSLVLTIIIRHIIFARVQLFIAYLTLDVTASRQGRTALFHTETRGQNHKRFHPRSFNTAPRLCALTAWLCAEFKLFQIAWAQWKVDHIKQVV